MTDGDDASSLVSVIVPTYYRNDLLAEAIEMWPCMTSTMLVDGRILQEVLPLSDRSGAHDLELMIQLAQLTEFDFVDAPLLYKRIDRSSLGSSVRTAVDCRKQLIAEYDDLYAVHPVRVHRTALANTYETRGALLSFSHTPTDSIRII